MREEIVNIIENELKSIAKPFLQELDMQIFLFHKLAQHFGYESVHLEYPIIQPGGNETLGYIDLVVEASNIFFPIELKYKTSKEFFDFTCFGELTKYTLRNHSAYNLNCYGFWADVSRMEKLTVVFDKVSNGIGVFVTNDPAYSRGPETQNVGYANFALTEGRSIGPSACLKWNANILAANKPPEIELTNVYTIKWQEMTNLSNFKLLII
jgi:hypothetical protein